MTAARVALAVAPNVVGTTEDEPGPGMVWVRWGVSDGVPVRSLHHRDELTEAPPSENLAGTA